MEIGDEAVELHRNPALKPCNPESDVPETLLLAGWEGGSHPSSPGARSASLSQPGLQGQHAGMTQQPAARTRPQSAAVRQRAAPTSGMRSAGMRPTSALPGGERPSHLGAHTAGKAVSVRPASAQGWVGGGAGLRMMPEMEPATSQTRRPGTPRNRILVALLSTEISLMVCA